MDKINAFPTDWLDCRFPFDADARNVELEAQVLDYLRGIEKPHLMDLGAGNGANYHYLQPRIHADARWTLIEQDPYLVQAARERIPSPLVNLRSESLLHIAQAQNLAEVDLILANAVFDLFSEAQFRHFTQSLAPVRPSLFFTLNYTRMAFSPEMNEDEEFVRLYNAHMEREQDFGRAMGSQGPEKMVKILREAGYQVATGLSYWQIGGEEDEMLTYMLGFMEEALGEMLVWEGLDLPLREWLEDKREMVAAGALSLWVEHVDVWARRA
jgi:SAM-dependent methyltransferase